MPRVVLIFVDGLGLGEDAEFNPLVVVPTPGIRSYLAGASLSLESIGCQGEGALLLALDAALGVEGLPQSATGQASLFTGENAAALLGRHRKGFPNRLLRELLQEKGILRRLRAEGFQVTFANAFRPPFFSKLSRGVHLFSCSTATNYYAKLPFRTLEDVEGGRAIYADITNESLSEQGYPVTVITPEAGARRLASLASAHDFTLFEYFLTDLAAHSGDPLKVREVIMRLDRFLGALRQELPADVLLMVTSDHGNIEDMRVKEHTHNPVPALVWGHNQEYFRNKLQDITHVAPAIISYLQKHETG